MVNFSKGKNLLAALAVVSGGAQVGCESPTYTMGERQLVEGPRGPEGPMGPQGLQGPKGDPAELSVDLLNRISIIETQGQITRDRVSSALDEISIVKAKVSDLEGEKALLADRIIQMQEELHYEGVIADFRLAVSRAMNAVSLNLAYGYAVNHDCLMDPLVPDVICDENYVYSATPVVEDAVATINQLNADACNATMPNEGNGANWQRVVKVKHSPWGYAYLPKVDDLYEVVKVGVPRCTSE